MSTLNREGIGTAHRRLADVAQQLREDDHMDWSAYVDRANTERDIYDSLVDLGEVAYREGPKNIDDWKIGANLVDYLLERGWTPPAHFNGRITE